jgi:hypothetical protein
VKSCTGGTSQHNKLFISLRSIKASPKTNGLDRERAPAFGEAFKLTLFYALLIPLLVG